MTNQYEVEINYLVNVLHVLVKVYNVFSYLAMVVADSFLRFFFKTYAKEGV